MLLRVALVALLGTASTNETDAAAANSAECECLLQRSRNVLSILRIALVVVVLRVRVALVSATVVAGAVVRCGSSLGVAGSCGPSGRRCRLLRLRVLRLRVVVWLTRATTATAAAGIVGLRSAVGVLGSKFAVARILGGVGDRQKAH